MATDGIKPGFGPYDAAILALRQALKGQRKMAQYWKYRNGRNLRVLRLLIVILGATATLWSGLSNIEGLKELGPYVIIPTTLVTIATGIGGIFNFTERYAAMSDLRQQLSALESEVEVDIDCALAASPTKIVSAIGPDGLKPEPYLRSKYDRLAKILEEFESKGRSENQKK